MCIFFPESTHSLTAETSLGPILETASLDINNSTSGFDAVKNLQVAGANPLFNFPE